jgi:transcriptional regulator with XRE-family HTH domain
MDIGKKLKEKRQEANLTQKELAEILHVSRQTISSWEVGRTYPDLDILVAISELYDTPLDDLLKEDSEMVKDITEKVKKSQRRKVMNIVLGVLLLMTIGTGLFWGWENYQNNQENAYGLKPNDLLNSTWELVYTPSENLSNSNLSFDSDSLMIWNDYSTLLKPTINPTELEENTTEELSEIGLEEGLVTYKDLSIEVVEETYIVSAYGYQQRFERLSDSVIQDANGTEYSIVRPSSSHRTLNTLAEELE